MSFSKRLFPLSYIAFHFLQFAFLKKKKHCLVSVLLNSETSEEKENNLLSIT